MLGGSDTITTMLAKATGVTRVNPAVDQINQIMAERHNIRDASKRDVTVTALQREIDIRKAIGARRGAIMSPAIGLAAGSYPARRAARLRPIEALRFQ